MDTENTPRAFSLEEGVAALRQSREDQAKPQASEEEAKTEPEEVQEDQPEGEAEEESTPEAEQSEDLSDGGEDEGSEDDLYEVGGEQFTLAELREWKKGAMRTADYTRKTQEVAELRKSFEAERAQWDAERDSAISQIKQQQVQLKEALATFAVEQDPEPSPEGLSWEEYTKRKTAWDKRQDRKNQARAAYKQLQAEQTNEVLQRETAQVLRYFPAWKDPEVFRSEASEMVRIAGDYGFTPEEMNGISDHRIFRVLGALRALTAEASKRKASEAKAATKVAMAARQLSPGSKTDSKNQQSKELRQKRDQLRKSGGIDDAVALLQARRARG